MATWSVAHKPDHVLLRDLGSIVQRDFHNTAEMLAHIAETDARGLHRAAAYPNMYQYCLGELHMSEDAAFKRIRVARAARDFPEILELLADGRLHLSGALTLAPALTCDTAPGLLAAAVHKTRAQIEQMLADRFPRADVPTSLQPLPVSHSTVEAKAVGGELASFRLGCDSVQAAATATSVAGNTDANTISLAPGRPVPSQAQTSVHSQVPLSGRDRIAPLGSGRYELRTTLDQETHDLLRQLQSLLAHAVPSGDIPELLKRALKLAVQDVERRRFAASSRQGKKRASKNARHIPAGVRRAVRERDGARCTFVSASGKRCEHARFLEYDHIQPVARGGQATLANIRLRCRAHNQLEAERTYSAGFMSERRQAARARAKTENLLRGVAAERSQMRAGVPGPPDSRQVRST